MNRKHLWMFAAFLVICGTAAFASCRANDDHTSDTTIGTQYIPQAPNYDAATMWGTAAGDADGTGADVFYVVSTMRHIVNWQPPMSWAIK